MRLRRETASRDDRSGIPASRRPRIISAGDDENSEADDLVRHRHEPRPFLKGTMQEEKKKEVVSCLHCQLIIATVSFHFWKREGEQKVEALLQICIACAVLTPLSGRPAGCSTLLNCAAAAAGLAA